MSESVVVITLKSQKAPGEKVFRLHKKRIVLGSATSSDIKLDDSAVSPIHAILEVSGVDGRPVVYDLASETGIKVNGKPSVQETLNSGDQIQIGPYFISVAIRKFEEVAEAPKLVKEAVGGQKLFVSEQEDLAPLLLEDEAEVHEIFDERPTMKQSLQVVMFYQDTILDVEHFVNRKRIVIGPGTKEDFSIPPFLGQGKDGRFELVTVENGKHMLHLNDKMEGVVSHNGKLVPVRELISSMSTASSKAYPLEDKGFAKVKLNDVSFFVNFSPAPPKLLPPKLIERDPLFAKILFTSISFTIALMITLGSLHVDPKIEIEQLPERVATIIYEPKLQPIEKPPQPKVKQPEPEPEKPKEAPKKIKVDVKPSSEKPKQAKEIAQKAPKAKTTPKTPPKNVTQAAPQNVPKPNTPPKKSGGQEGQGEKAAGKEGKRGEKNAPKAPVPQDKALRPGPVKQKTNQPAASNVGKSQTDSLGVVDVFRQNKGTLNKLFAGGKGAANSVDKLKGYSGFTTQGEGGLGAAGSESGGGGKSVGLGGLSDKGAGGGKKGDGLGALGSGGNILGGSGKLAIQSGGVPEPVVLGGIDEDAIRRAIDEHRDQIKYCYEKEINAERPDLAGRIGVRWVIGASGTVTSAGISSTTLRNANTERCVVEVIKRIQFPPVRGGGVAEVTYPFVFKPSNR